MATLQRSGWLDDPQHPWWDDDDPIEDRLEGKGRDLNYDLAVVEEIGDPTPGSCRGRIRRLGQFDDIADRYIIHGRHSSECRAWDKPSATSSSPPLLLLAEELQEGDAGEVGEETLDLAGAAGGELDV